MLYFCETFQIKAGILHLNHVMIVLFKIYDIGELGWNDENGALVQILVALTVCWEIQTSSYCWTWICRWVFWPALLIYAGNLKASARSESTADGSYTKISCTLIVKKCWKNQICDEIQHKWQRRVKNSQLTEYN